MAFCGQYPGPASPYYHKKAAAGGPPPSASSLLCNHSIVRGHCCALLYRPGMGPWMSRCIPHRAPVAHSSTFLVHQHIILSLYLHLYILLGCHEHLDVPYSGAVGLLGGFSLSDFLMWHGGPQLKFSILNFLAKGCQRRPGTAPPTDHSLVWNFEAMSQLWIGDPLEQPPECHAFQLYWF